MKYTIFIFFFFTFSLWSQDDILKSKPSRDNSIIVKDTIKKPSVELYKIYTLERDTTYVDTTLSIQKEYKFNYLRKDNFGLLSFSNEGQTYNTLDFNLQSKANSVNFGFTAKHFAYKEVSDISYYEVPTPLTDLYYKSVMTQGQNLDAFLTVNTKPNLNLFIGYKGLRSNGKYINNLSSTGNFKIGGTYFTTNKKYTINFHFTSQDISNQENGGIVNKVNFESSEAPFNQRERLEVYLEDATSLLKGSRYFINQRYKLNKSSENNSSVFHQFNYEYKQFYFDQLTANSRFGSAYRNIITDNSKLKTLNNTLGYNFNSANYGNISLSAQHLNYNSYYNNVVYNSSGAIEVPNQLTNDIVLLRGTYKKQINGFHLFGSYNQSVDGSGIRDLLLRAKYKYSDDIKLSASYTQTAALPNINYSLLQSSYTNYNWLNNFKNEQSHALNATVESPFVNLIFNAKTLSNHLYFADTSTDASVLLVKPFQASDAINYISMQASKEFTYKKWALDNRVLYQKVDHNNPILNVPDLLLRSTIYYTDYVFNNAMEIQVGLTGQYFTSFHANNYNPLIGEFYVQNNTKVGNFPMFDFFLNAKVKQTRFFLKAEHFNSSFTGYNFYAAPDYPYRDFIVRFGLVWNFFL